MTTEHKQLERTQEFLTTSAAQDPGYMAGHQCELLAMLVDKIDDLIQVVGELKQGRDGFEEALKGLLVPPGAGKPAKKKATGAGPIKLDTWLEQRKEEGAEQPIPRDHRVFEYKREKNIPDDFFKLAWAVFKEWARDGNKKKADWPGTFLNCLKEQGYGIWYCNAAGEYMLTSKGQQAMQDHKATMHGSNP